MTQSFHRTEMNPLPKTFIVTINFRKYRDTIECLESLLQQDYPDFQIFILENGSNDSSSEKLATWGKAKLGDDFLSITAGEIEKAAARFFKKKVILITSNENLGFAGGNNLVIPIAIKMGARYIWLINNDTIQKEDSLKALVETAQLYDKAGMVCSEVLSFSEPYMIESLGSRLIIPLGIFRHIGKGLKGSDVPSVPLEVPYVYGCSFLISEKLVRDIGLMDERYFLVREESDWSLRARRRGWKIYSAPSSIVCHKGSTSIGKRSEVFCYYAVRNTLLFMRKYYPFFLPLVILSMFPMVTGLILVDNLFSKQGNLLRKIKMVVLGYFHFFKGKFGSLKI